MKVKYDRNEYLSGYLQNDIEILKKAYERVPQTRLAICLISLALVNHIIFLLNLDNIILNTLFLALTLVTLYFVFIYSHQYNQTKDLVLLVKRNLALTTYSLIEFTYLGMLLIVMMDETVLIGIFSVLIISIITTIIFIFYYNKYMYIKKTEINLIVCGSLSVLLAYLLLKYFINDVFILEGILIVCLVAIISGVAESLVRTKRLLSFELSKIEE